MKFEELKVSKELSEGLAAAGFSEMFPIQEQAIPPVLEGKDVIGKAQSGSGKTLAFAIPVLQRIDSKVKGAQALILAPTRELAQQIAVVIESITKNKQIRVAVLYGGVGYEPQKRALREGAQIIVATPGRLIDHIRQGTANLRRIKILVLDEADRMLDMGFIVDTEWIIRQTPRERQTMLFSATLPDEIRHIVTNHMRDPVTVELNRERPAVDTVKQMVWIVNETERLPALQRILDTEKPPLCIIFCATKRGADRLHRALSGKYKVEVIHGDLSQAQRDRVLNKFRNNEVSLLIATDVAARGIDVEDVTHVINYELPRDVETYIHRIGRAGRAGRSGTAISLVAPDETVELGRIEFTVKVRSEKRRFLHGQLHPVDPEEFGAQRAIVPRWSKTERRHRARPISQSDGRGPRQFGGHGRSSNRPRHFSRR